MKKKLQKMENIIKDMEGLKADIKINDAAIKFLDAKIDELKAAEPMRLLREERDRLIAATDWWASSDVTMTSAQTKYRQDLRDITKSATSLDDVSWPEKP